MPSSTQPAASAAPARLRLLQRRLPALSVSQLLRIREAIEPVLAHDRIRLSDVDAVLHVAEDD
ncbi:MAG: hypothetical protein JF887_10550 [Candidatus Dormibacteraeota bacterium]|uniref:Uncharacterized protein n=1 Tax=Candidatus Amunia macphersoniae TaxID=3127014 RepID=A0A934KPJ7_9BACT|nr:hypothetical protein [Candidatus Dormibacteraeota bacterium]